MQKSGVDAYIYTLSASGRQRGGQRRMIKKKVKFDNEVEKLTQVK